MCLPALSEARHPDTCGGLDSTTRSGDRPATLLRRSRCLPVLTPQAITPCPGPSVPVHLPTLSLCLAVVVRDPHSGRLHFACVKASQGLPRLVPTRGAHVVRPARRRGTARTSSPVPGAAGPRLPRVSASPAVATSTLAAPTSGRVCCAVDRRADSIDVRYGAVVRVEVEQAMPRPSAIAAGATSSATFDRRRTSCRWRSRLYRR